MFHKVRVLNKKGQLLKEITSEVLSNRHWTIFEEKLKPRPGKKNKFNDFGISSNVVCCIKIKWYKSGVPSYS